MLQTNMTSEEKKAMKELRDDNTRGILTANKGVTMVVMDTHDQIKKAEDC